MQDENNQTVGLNGRRNYTLLVGHSGPVYSATFSPPGDYVLSSSADTTSMYLCIPLHDIHILAQFEFFLLPTFVFVSAVRLWSTKLNANLVCYKGHNHTVWDAQVELFVLHKLEVMMSRHLYILVSWCSLVLLGITLQAVLMIVLLGFGQWIECNLCG